MNNHYNVLAVLSKASFIDPRFKMDLSAIEQQDTMDSILDELVESCHSSVGVGASTNSSCYMWLKILLIRDLNKTYWKRCWGISLRVVIVIRWKKPQQYLI